MQLTTIAAILASLAAGASAHMQMVSPAPFRGKDNPNAATKDFELVGPLNPAKGRPFPCHGYLSDLGTPAGAPTATFAAGQQATFRTEGVEAAHNGGSCQVSLSFDNGQTWKVIKSFIGNCVRSAGGNVFDPNQTYSFTIPADAKAGDAIFAWTWFNNTGNREMYMNCAAVTITGSGTSTLNNLPDMFVANVGNGCSTAEGSDLDFPNPGADIERGGSKPLAPPVGTCQAPSGAPVPAPPPGNNSGVISQPPAGVTHTVQPGEFCFSIAQKNGVTVEQIIANNPGVNAGCTNLQVGQVLNLRRRSRVMRARV